MDVIDLRLTGPEELRPLLEEERAVWRENLRWDFSSTAAMVLRFLEARALNGYALRDGGRVIGYSFYVVEHNKCLIGDAFVSPAFRNGTNEVQLMTHVLETIQATPGVGRVEAQLLNLTCPALSDLFRSGGFQQYDRKFLCLSLSDAPSPDATEHLGIRFAAWESKWFQPAAALILAAYRGHVDSLISDQYRTQAGAVRFLENIIRFPGCGVFQPEASCLAFSQDNELCGMILTSVVSERVAHITQLCVAPRWQGRGVGRALIGRAIAFGRRHGFESATLSVTAANRRAVELYSRMGFERLASFPAYVWDAPLRAERISQKKAAARR